jgi:hypothetical protein
MEVYSYWQQHKGGQLGRKKRAIGDRQLEVVSARVRPEIYRKIEQIAKEGDVTMTHVVRRILVDGIHAYQQKVSQQA